MIYQPIYLHSYLRSDFCPGFKYLTNQGQRPNLPFGKEIVPSQTILLHTFVLIFVV